MILELETLNSWVDGYLDVVYEERAGIFQEGKIDMLTNFRDQLAKVPSNKEGEELIKLLNRGLLKASTTPKDISLNRKKGFEEALVNVQNKIKELFNLEDLSTGTIKQYLQDVPHIPIAKKVSFPPVEAVFGTDGEMENDPTKKIKEIAENIKKNIESQLITLKNHQTNNGKLFVLSDEGYTCLDEIDEDALGGLIEGSNRSLKELDAMVSKATALINAVMRQRGKGGNDDKKGGLEDLMRGLGLNPDGDDDK